MHKLFLALLVIVLTSPLSLSFAQSQGGVDRQLRVLNHIQKFEENKRVGWAGWVIAPNVLRADPFRGLLVGGVALRDKKKTRWVELMGGAFVDTAGSVDPVIDVRAEQNFAWNKDWLKKIKLNQFKLTEEVLYAFDSGRLLLPTTVTTPLPVPKKLEQFKLRVGTDSDVVHDQNGWHAGLGPRISGVVPKTEGKVILATTYQFGLHRQRDVWRTYIVINL